jgi:hypothetical protein
MGETAMDECEINVAPSCVAWIAKAAFECTKPEPPDNGRTSNTKLARRANANNSIRSASSAARSRSAMKAAIASAASSMWRTRTRSSGGILGSRGTHHLIAKMPAEIGRRGEIDPASAQQSCQV